MRWPTASRLEHNPGRINLHEDRLEEKGTRREGGGWGWTRGRKGQGEKAVVGIGLEDRGERRKGSGWAKLEEEDVLGLLPHSTYIGRGSIQL